MINIIHISYIFISLIALIILIKLYIKLKFKFWAYQPVFHYFNLFYWCMPSSGIINTELPRPNKYCDFFNIMTTTFNERKEREIQRIVDFLQNNYLFGKNYYYKPTIDSFASYLIGNEMESLISTYYSTQSLIHTKNLSVNLLFYQ